MARNKTNNLTRGLSGKIGELVFSQRDGETIIGKKRLAPAYRTAGQQAAVDRFKNATIYAKGAAADPELGLFYASRATKGRTAFVMAVTDYLKPVIIHEIDAAQYNGSMGSKLRIAATSIGRVLSLNVRIESAGGSLIEEGMAQAVNGTDNWWYTATTTNSNPPGSVITVIAKDLPGHFSTHSKTL